MNSAQWRIVFVLLLLLDSLQVLDEIANPEAADVKGPEAYQDLIDQVYAEIEFEEVFGTCLLLRRFQN